MHADDGALCRRAFHDRRRDGATAAAVEVALLYLNVFGNGAARQYLPLTDIPAAIARRIGGAGGQLRQR